MPRYRAHWLVASCFLLLSPGCQTGTKAAPSKTSSAAGETGEAPPAEPAEAAVPSLEKVCGHMTELARQEWEAKKSEGDAEGAVGTDGASQADEKVPDFDALERQCKMEVGRKKQKQPVKYEQMARCAVKAEKLEALFLCDPDAKKTTPKDPKLAPTRNDDAPPPLPKSDEERPAAAQATE